MTPILLVDFLIGRNNGGHVAEYLGLLRTALADLEPDVLAPYTEPVPPSGRIARYRRFAREIVSAFRGGAVVVFHTPEGRDILVLWLLTSIPGLRRGRAVMMMRRGAEIMVGRDDWRARLLERGVRSLVRRRVLHVVSDSRAASRTWEAITGGPVPVIQLPVRAALIEGRRARAADGPLQVALLGLFRREKGIEHYESVLRLARDVEPDARLLCQVGDEPVTSPEREITDRLRDAYRGDANATIHAGHLASDEYDRALLASDVVVLPYDPSLYTSGTSGLMFDALAAGAIVLSTRIAWGVDEFGDSSSVVWLDGLDDGAIRSGLTEAFARARHRRVDGMPSDLPTPEAFGTGWTAVVQEVAADNGR